MTEIADPVIYQLIYRSRSALTGSKALVEGIVAEILELSRKNNERSGLTGALMLSDQIFVQVLEGASAAIEDTFERVCCDMRHADIELISFLQVPSRMFGAWHMHRVLEHPMLEVLIRPPGRSLPPEDSMADAILNVASKIAILAPVGPKAGASAAPSDT